MTIHTELCECYWCHPEKYLAEIAADNHSERQAKFNIENRPSPKCEKPIYRGAIPGSYRGHQGG